MGCWFTSPTWEADNEVWPAAPSGAFFFMVEDLHGAVPWYLLSWVYLLPLPSRKLTWLAGTSPFRIRYTSSLMVVVSLSCQFSGLYSRIRFEGRSFLNGLLLTQAWSSSQFLLNDSWRQMEKVETPRKTGWWFQTFFIFIPIWGRLPFWLIFFKWVGSTTNHKMKVFIHRNSWKKSGLWRKILFPELHSLMHKLQ